MAGIIERLRDPLQSMTQAACRKMMEEAADVIVACDQDKAGLIAQLYELDAYRERYEKLREALIDALGPQDDTIISLCVEKPSSTSAGT